MAGKLWSRDYILLLQGNAVSCIGDMMYSVAIGYWVYQKTGSSSLMGIMSAISMFVTVVLAPFSGSIADKCNRKRMLVGTDIVQGMIMLTIGALAYLDRLNVPGVLITAFLAALCSAFYSPAVRTLMIDIIPRDDMVRGQSFFSGTMSLIDMVGTAFSGVMVAFFGVPLIVIFNGLSNLYCALTEMFIRVPRTAQQGEQLTAGSILQDSKESVRTIFTDRHLRLFIPCTLVLNLLSSGPLSLALPFCMEKGFSVDLYGYLMSVWTAAALLSVMILGFVKLSAKTRLNVLRFGYTGSVLFFILAFMSRKFVPMCAAAFLASFANCAGNTVFNASLMLALPKENRGAIFGLIQSASVGGAALSAVVYGILGDVLPLYLVFTAGSVLSLAPMLYLCFHPLTGKFILEH